MDLSIESDCLDLYMCPFLDLYHSIYLLFIFDNQKILQKSFDIQLQWSQHSILNPDN